MGAHTLASCDPSLSVPHNNWTTLTHHVINNITFLDKLAAHIELKENNNLLNDEVTAYFNLGNFKKGSQQRSAQQSYQRWMNIFSLISNPVIAWFDNPVDAGYFQKIRSSLPENRTMVHVIHRSSTWSFSNTEPKIKHIYSRPGYPKYHPNTVLPEYSSVMHAKYELMFRAVYENHFNTLYFAWLDIGLFRQMVDESPIEHFELYIPPGMEQNKVAYSKVYTRS